MKLRLPLSLKSALCALVAGAATLNAQDSTAKTDIGKWMLIGDSISHGTFNCTYRWNIQQVFIDNGIKYDAVGPLSGGYYGGYDTATYGGVEFDNEHAAQYNIYGKEISGRELPYTVMIDEDTEEVSHDSQDPPYSVNKSGRETSMLHTNVYNWLGISDDLTTHGVSYDPYGGVYEDLGDQPLVIDGREYTKYSEAWEAAGRSTAPTYTPDTVTIMMGTNDRKNQMLFYPGIEDVEKSDSMRNEAIRADIKSVLDAVVQVNPDADIYLMTMPYTNQVNGGGYMRLPWDVTMQYNAELTHWVENLDMSNVHLVDINAGMLDVSMEHDNAAYFQPGGAAPGMMADWTHMSTQGNLIVAGNLAKGMGYAGRTAGQARKGAESFGNSTYARGFAGYEASAGVTIDAENRIVFDNSNWDNKVSLTFEWESGADLSHGYTVEFNLLYGNGAATNGGDTTWVNGEDLQFSVFLGDGVNYGTLNISEAYIKWGEDILYSRDASVQGENLRIAYVVGDRSNDLAAGYYVWLGDQLIGEACQVTFGSEYADGVTFSYAGVGMQASLSSLAMDSTGSWAPTSRLVYDTDGFVATQGSACHNAAQGVDAFEGVYQLGRYTNDDVSKRLVSEHRVRHTEGDTKFYFANYEGDRAFYEQTYADYSESDCVSYFIDGVKPLNQTVWQFGDGDRESNMAAYGMGSRKGDIKVRFFDQNPGYKAVYGVYDSSSCGNALDGSVVLQLDARGAHYGNVYGAANMGVEGLLKVVANTGTVDGDLFGAFENGTSADHIGSTQVFVNFDALVSGSVYGGSKDGDGVVDGDTRVVVTGGRIMGSVYGGGKSGAISGSSSVTVTGGQIDGSIYGGFADSEPSGTVTVEGNKARILGDIIAETVVLRNVVSGNDEHGFDKYANRITAKQSLTLENVTAEKLAAIIDTDELVVKGNTKTSLTAGDSRIGKVSIEDGSSIGMTLQEGSTLSVGDLTLSEGSAAELDSTTASLVTMAVTGKLSAGQGCGVSGNVEMMTGSTLDFAAAEGLNVTGSVTLHAGITLSSDMLAAAEGLEEGEYLTLFTGATEMLLRGRSDVRLMKLAGYSADSLDLVTDADAADYFNNLAKGEYTVAFSHNTEGVGLVTLQKGTPLTSVPEPASSTLSLLALAALAGRRRRK